MWRPTMLESHVKIFFLAICECELRAVLLLLKKREKFLRTSELLKGMPICVLRCFAGRFVFFAIF